jgi:hypothetical protein
VEKKAHETPPKPDVVADDGHHDGSHHGLKACNITAAVEKRSLRSNDGGSRSKSELAMYFQNYEQILSLDPVKPGNSNPITLISPLHVAFVAQRFAADVRPTLP